VIIISGCFTENKGAGETPLFGNLRKGITMFDMIRRTDDLSIVQPKREPDRFPTPAAQILSVFRAEWARWKLVYWFDYRTMGIKRTILRRAKFPGERLNKQEDTTVKVWNGMPDMDLIRISIAADAQFKRATMTDVRWELHEGFGCDNLVEYGRFDHLDLLGRTDPDRMRALISSNQAEVDLSPEAWDFDSVLLLGVCPACRLPMRDYSVPFNPEHTYCEKCGWKSDTAGRDKTKDGQFIISLTEALIKKALAGPEAAPAEPLSERPPELEFVELVCTPLLCLIFAEDLQKVLFGPNEAKDKAGLIVPGRRDVAQLLSRSIFPEIANADYRSRFSDLAKTYADRRIAKVRTGEFLLNFPGPQELKEAYVQKRIRESEEDAVGLARSLDVIASLVNRWADRKHEEFEYHQIAWAVHALKNLIWTTEEFLNGMAGKLRLANGGTP
jgi:hypothetical protein